MNFSEQDLAIAAALILVLVAAVMFVAAAVLAVRR